MMEVELLRGMISDREERIAKIERLTAEIHEKIQRIAADLEAVSEQNQEVGIQLMTEKTQLLHTRQNATTALEQAQQELNQQGMSLRAYAGAVKEDQMSDAAYVMRMQAQLCKAMHSLGILDHQMELAKSHSEAMIKFQKEALAELTNEKTHVELNLMNELVKKDTEQRAIDNQFMEKFNSIRHEIDAIREQVMSSDEESGSDSESEDEEEEKKEKHEEEECDEEEMEAKRELFQMLQDKLEEVKRLEKLIEEQEDTIAELEDHLEELGFYDEENSKRISVAKARNSIRAESGGSANSVPGSAGPANSPSNGVLDDLAAIRNLISSKSADSADESPSDLPDDMDAIRNLIANRSLSAEDASVGEDSDEGTDEDSEGDEGEPEGGPSEGAEQDPASANTADASLSHEVRNKGGAIVEHLQDPEEAPEDAVEKDSESEMESSGQDFDEKKVEDITSKEESAELPANAVQSISSNGHLTEGVTEADGGTDEEM